MCELEWTLVESTCVVVGRAGLRFPTSPAIPGCLPMRLSESPTGGRPPDFNSERLESLRREARGASVRPAERSFGSGRRRPTCLPLATTHPNRINGTLKALERSGGRQEAAAGSPHRRAGHQSARCPLVGSERCGPAARRLSQPVRHRDHGVVWRSRSAAGEAGEWPLERGSRRRELASCGARLGPHLRQPTGSLLATCYYRTQVDQLREIVLFWGKDDFGAHQPCSSPRCSSTARSSVRSFSTSTLRTRASPLVPYSK